MTDVFQDFAKELTERVSRGVALSDQEFGGLALELYRLQYLYVAPYGRFCDQLNRSPDHVTDWTQIPTVPVAAFKEFEMTSLPAADRAMVFLSSGTTGYPCSRHFHSAESLSHYRRMTLPWFKVQVLPDYDRISLVSLIPAASRAPQSSLAHMTDAVRERFGNADSVNLSRVADDGTWTVMPAEVFGVLEEQVRSDQPCLLVGTAYGFVHLLEDWEAKGWRLRLPEGSRLMETGGYKGRSKELTKAELHHRLSLALGLSESHLVSEYGMSELGSQAYDRSVGEQSPRRFRFPSWCRARMVAPGTAAPPRVGQPGLITLMDLANVYSVLALQTEDVGLAIDDGFEIVGRARYAEARGCSLMHA